MCIHAVSQRLDLPRYEMSPGKMPAPCMLEKHYRKLTAMIAAELLALRKFVLYCLFDMCNIIWFIDERVK